MVHFLSIEESLEKREQYIASQFEAVSRIFKQTLGIYFLAEAL